LESGNIDYAFEYKNVAEKHQMEFLEFPPEINLSSDNYLSLCQDIKAKLVFQRLASVNADFNIQPIVYGITIPKNAPQPKLAVEWIKFLLSEKGIEILREKSQSSIIPALVDNQENLPGGLSAFLTEE